MSTYARYTIHVPVRDDTGNEIPHVLGNARRALTTAGFHGRTVIRKTQGDYGDFDTQEMDLIMVDAPNDEKTRNAMRALAKGIKHEVNQDAVYLTVQPIEYEMI